MGYGSESGSTNPWIVQVGKWANSAPLETGEALQGSAFCYLGVQSIAHGLLLTYIFLLFLGCRHHRVHSESVAPWIE